VSAARAGAFRNGLEAPTGNNVRKKQGRAVSGGILEDAPFFARRRVSACRVGQSKLSILQPRAEAMGFLAVYIRNERL
jgi:hypothetical protein